MARLTAINPETATGKTKELFDGIQAQLGMVPNMMRTMANSTAMLEGYLKLSSTLGGGKLGAVRSGLIALTVAESNSCNYCLSAHTYIGGNMLKIDAAAMGAARGGESADPKTAAILAFTQTLVSKRGLVSDADVDTLKAAGVNETEIAEIVGHTALNILTNYFNNTAGTVVDFPLVESYSAATV